MLKKWLITLPTAGLALCLYGCDVDVDNKPDGEPDITVEDKTPDTIVVPDRDDDTDVDVDLKTDRPSGDPDDRGIEGSIKIDEN